MIQAIIGLGNPGTEYQNTRHNVGFWFAQRLAEQHAGTFRSESKYSGLHTKIQIAAHPIHLLLPMTYMNESGRAVGALVRYFKIPAEDILVAHDELDFPAGTIRLKQGGGHGGHNGLRSIIAHLGTKNFLRLRIGIGHPGNSRMVSPYVLSAPPKTDKEKIVTALEEATTIIPDLIDGDLDKAFRLLHNTEE